MKNKNDVVIVDAIRTAITSFNGSFANIPAHELGAFLIKELLKRNKIKDNEVDEVILGHVLTAGQGQNPARQSTIKSGLHFQTPAWTVNQVCGSGLKSVALGYQSIKCENTKIVICGGQENMSMAPHAIKLRDGIKMGDAKMIDTMQEDGLTDAFNRYLMGVTAENIARKWNFSREAQDEFSLNSQQKAEKAQKENKFKDEIIPYIISTKKGDVIIDKDEFPRHGTTMESLAKLRPAFEKDGTVTAGNASGINDGAATILLTTREHAESRGMNIIATVRSWAQAGVEPEIMGVGPIYASKKALEKANWKVSDLELIEANEAFAAQAMSVIKELDLPKDIVNVNGGAIALGHPIGASGARVLTTLLHEMKRTSSKKGLATLCIGGGMGIAMCVELD
ncbi:MAG: acetyl-CoA C-acetyltransferase [Sphingobacteriia bacterium]|nr:acetyl-CoA C-acetyltransferase [Sphingobacteriia bacterium]